MAFYTNHGKTKFTGDWKVGSKIYPLQVVKNALDNAFPSRIQFSCPQYAPASQLFPLVDIALYPDFSEYWGLDVLHDGTSFLEYYDNTDGQWKSFPVTGGIPAAKFGCRVTADISSILNDLVSAGNPPWHIRIRWSDGTLANADLDDPYLVTIDSLETVRIWPSAEVEQAINKDTVSSLVDTTPTKFRFTVPEDIDNTWTPVVTIANNQVFSNGGTRYAVTSNLRSAGSHGCYLYDGATWASTCSAQIWNAGMPGLVDLKQLFGSAAVSSAITSNGSDMPGMVKYHWVDASGEQMTDDQSLSLGAAGGVVNPSGTAANAIADALGDRYVPMPEEIVDSTTVNAYIPALEGGKVYRFTQPLESLVIGADYTGTNEASIIFSAGRAVATDTIQLTFTRPGGSFTIPLTKDGDEYSFDNFGDITTYGAGSDDGYYYDKLAYGEIRCARTSGSKWVVESVVTEQQIWKEGGIEFTHEIDTWIASSTDNMQTWTYNDSTNARFYWQESEWIEDDAFTWEVHDGYYSLSIPPVNSEEHDCDVVVPADVKLFNSSAIVVSSGGQYEFNLCNGILVGGELYDQVTE